MTEQEWLSSSDPKTMLEYIQNPSDNANKHHLYPLSGHKLRLFGEACCLAHGSEPEMAEHVSATKDNPAAWAKAWASSVPNTASASVPQSVKAALLREIVGNPWRPVRVSRNGRLMSEVKAQRASVYGCCSRHADNMGCDCLNLAGHLLPSVLTWNGGAVVKMAQAIYDNRTFEQMPILADALEDSGCQDEAILWHCRGFEPCPLPSGTTGHECNSAGMIPLRGPHVRGCWVLDLLLGKE